MGIDFKRQVPSEFRSIFSEAAVNFVATLARLDRQGFFGGCSLKELRQMRLERQKWIDEGHLPDFSSEVKELAADLNWRTRPVPSWLDRRWVEITGPADDRKGMLYRFNSGADVTLEDLEDATSPTWLGRCNAFLNLRDAVNGTLTFEHPQKGMIALNKERAVLKIRPRGLHLTEKNMVVDDDFVPASIFDFGFAFYHTGRRMYENGQAPSWYIPKTESRHESRWWNALVAYAEYYFSIRSGRSSLTYLAEDILGVLDAEGIIFESRDRIDGLNCGRWDEIASFLYKFRKHPCGLLPDRGLVTMKVPFMQAYADHIIAVCHRRGIHAVGGMAAQVPYKGDDEFNERMFAKVREDKEREVLVGHDGTWVAHPDFVPVARRVFEQSLGRRNHQIDRPSDRQVTVSELLVGFSGPITWEGVREVVHASLEYRRAYLQGIGAAAITYRKQTGELVGNLMEDAATCRISDNLVWRWLRETDRDRVCLEDGRFFNLQLLQQAIQEKIDAAPGHYNSTVVDDYYGYVIDPKVADHFTLRTYEKLLLSGAS